MGAANWSLDGRVDFSVLPDGAFYSTISGHSDGQQHRRA